MDGTILSQGSFTQPATAVNQIVAVPSGIDWFMTYNKTQIDAATNSAGVAFYWQRGMPAGYAIEYQNNAASTATLMTSITSGGFTLYDPSGQTAGAQPLLGPAVAISAITGNVTRPVVTHTADTNVVVGTVVRVSNTALTDVNGIDMVVGTVTDSTHFTLLTASNVLATAPGVAAGGAGFYRIVYNANTGLFYPRRRYIVNITQATNAQVSTAIAHGLTPGQEVRFNIPAVAGMTQLDETLSGGYSSPLIAATIVSVVDDYNFTINVDTTGYTAFTYPTIAQQPSSFPEVTPVGEDTGFALTSNTNQVPSIGGVQINNTNTGILADSTVNTGFLGMILPTGVNSPGGIAADTVYWRAGKASFGGL
jgi:hypothetical protein